MSNYRILEKPEGIYNVQKDCGEYKYYHRMGSQWKDNWITECSFTDLEKAKKALRTLKANDEGIVHE